MKGNFETTTHILLVDKKELDVFMEVFLDYTQRNKRKKNGVKLFKQFEDELQIY